MGHNKERLAEQLFVQRRVFAALNRISFFMDYSFASLARDITHFVLCIGFGVVTFSLDFISVIVFFIRLAINAVTLISEFLTTYNLGHWAEPKYIFPPED